MHLPEDAFRKAINDPGTAISFVWNDWVLDSLCHVHSALRQRGLPEQALYLPRLRRSDNFCLVVLDACRYDVFAEMFEEYFIGGTEPIWATGRDTFEYLRFLWPEVYDFPYITAASPVTSEKFEFNNWDSARGLAASGQQLFDDYGGYVPSNHFPNLVEVWRSSWDESLGVCPPEPVTDTAVEVIDDTASNRAVVHYFQPHGPFIGDEEFLGSIEKYDTDVRGGGIEAGIWDAVRNGDITDRKLRRLYTSNLRRVLPAVCELIRRTSFDKYVLMGDHGEALGEYGKYYHSIEHPKVRVVPWATIEGVRTDAPEMWEYTPSEPTKNKDTRARLRELGYIS